MGLFEKENEGGGDAEEEGAEDQEAYIDNSAAGGDLGRRKESDEEGRGGADESQYSDRPDPEEPARAFIRALDMGVFVAEFDRRGKHEDVHNEVELGDCSVEDRVGAAHRRHDEECN